MHVTAEPATARILFVKLPYTLVTEEAERIGLDHRAKISASSDSDTSRAADTLQVRHPHGGGDQGAPGLYLAASQMKLYFEWEMKQ